MTTALFLLRCTELGIAMGDLDYLDVGMVYDMFTEHDNDSAEWRQIATQRDMDNF